VDGKKQSATPESKSRSVLVSLAVLCLLAAVVEWDFVSTVGAVFSAAFCGIRAIISQLRGKSPFFAGGLITVGILWLLLLYAQGNQVFDIQHLTHEGGGVSPISQQAGPDVVGNVKTVQVDNADSGWIYILTSNMEAEEANLRRSSSGWRCNWTKPVCTRFALFPRVAQVLWAVRSCVALLIACAWFVKVCL